MSYTSTIATNNTDMKHQNFDEDVYFSRIPVKKQTEDEKPSKGKKPRKKDYAEERNRKREFE